MPNSLQLGKFHSAVFTKLKNRSNHHLTSNSSLSFEARDLKFWIQTASSLAEKCTICIFLYFAWELRNEGVTKLTSGIRLK